MRGWAKVKKVLVIIKATKGHLNLGGAVSEENRVTKFSYKKLVILPNSKFLFYWNLLKSLFLLYILLIVPYRGFIAIDIIIDIFFWIDIILNFFIAYTEKTKIINNFSKIAGGYVKGWFIFDVISNIPYYGSSGDTMSNIYGLRFIRFLRLKNVMEGYENFCFLILNFCSDNFNVVKSMSSILNFILLLALLGQFLACVWFSLGTRNKGWISNLLYQKDDVATSPTYNQVIYIPPKNSQYISSLYWVFTTLTTLGYGDIYGITVDEMIFTMLVEFLGVFVFAYMMGNINSLVQKLDDDHIEYLQMQSENLDQWIIKIDRANPSLTLPITFIQDLRNGFLDYWKKDHTTVIENNSFLMQMPTQCRMELVNHLFSHFIKDFSVFFMGLETSFIHMICVNLVPKKFSQGTEIVEIGETAEDLYFVTNGYVTIGSKEGVTCYIDLPKFSFFGDHLILFNLKSSNSFIAKHNDVQCMCISRETFLSICKLYPYSQKVLKYKAYLRRRRFRMMKMQKDDSDRLKTKQRLARNVSNENVEEDIEKYEKEHDNIEGEFDDLDEENRDVKHTETVSPGLKKKEIDQKEEDKRGLFNEETLVYMSQMEQIKLQKSKQKERKMEAEAIENDYELISYARQLNEKIEALTTKLTNLNKDFKKKFKRIKTELEFILNYDEAIEGH